MNNFINIGMSNILNISRVLFITTPSGTTARRYQERAKEANMYHDARMGRKFKSLIVLDDGTVIASCITPRTLMRRFNQGEPNNLGKDEEDDDAEEEEEGEEQ